MHPISTTRPLFRQVALVTGASGEIGREIALALSRAGAYVALHYHTRRDSALEGASLCRQNGSEAVAVAANLTRRREVEAMVEHVTRSLGPIHILVNAAGRTRHALVADTTEEDWDDLIDINLKGVFLTCRSVLPTMIGRRYGRIINIASIWGQTGAAGEAAYSAAKGGVISFTRALAKEVARCGITVNAVAPGAVDTDMLAPLTEDEKAELAERIPVGRLGKPSDVAQAVVFLALPANDWLTGQTLSPNGGLYP